MLAFRAFKRSYLKTRCSRRDARQRRLRVTLGTTWPIYRRDRRQLYGLRHEAPVMLWSGELYRQFNEVVCLRSSSTQWNCVTLVLAHTLRSAFCLLLRQKCFLRKKLIEFIGAVLMPDDVSDVNLPSFIHGRLELSQHRPVLSGLL